MMSDLEERLLNPNWADALFMGINPQAMDFASRLLGIEHNRDNRAYRQQQADREYELQKQQFARQQRIDERNLQDADTGLQLKLHDAGARQGNAQLEDALTKALGAPADPRQHVKTRLGDYYLPTEIEERAKLLQQMRDKAAIDFDSPDEVRARTKYLEDIRRAVIEKGAIPAQLLDGFPVSGNKGPVIKLPDGSVYQYPSPEQIRERELKEFEGKESIREQHRPARAERLPKAEKLPAPSASLNQFETAKSNAQKYYKMAEMEKDSEKKALFEQRANSEMDKMNSYHQALMASGRFTDNSSGEWKGVLPKGSQRASSSQMDADEREYQRHYPTLSPAQRKRLEDGFEQDHGRRPRPPQR
jgi:hypothetical protein